MYIGSGILHNDNELKKKDAELDEVTASFMKHNIGNNTNGSGRHWPQSTKKKGGAWPAARFRRIFVKLLPPRVRFAYASLLARQSTTMIIYVSGSEKRKICKARAGSSAELLRACFRLVGPTFRRLSMTGAVGLKTTPHVAATSVLLQNDEAKLRISTHNINTAKVRAGPRRPPAQKVSSLNVNAKHLQNVYHY